MQCLAQFFVSTKTEISIHYEPYIYKGGVSETTHRKDPTRSGTGTETGLEGNEVVKTDKNLEPTKRQQMSGKNR